MWVQANTHVRLKTGKYVEFHVKFCLLGRGWWNRRRENLGIAKKGGGRLTYAKIFLVDL